MVPVQGRVGIRESKAPVGTGGTAAPGTALLDDTGDITLVCQDGRCPQSLTGLAAADAAGLGSEAAAAAAPANMKLVVILVAVLVPAGLAVCAAGVAAVVLRKRRRQKEEKQGNKGRPERPKKHQDAHDLSEGRQGVKQSWRSGDGGRTGASPAVLCRSNAGSDDGEYSNGDLNSHGTNVEQLQPGETGFGSMAGGTNQRFGAMVTLPPTTDSLDGFSTEHASGRPRWSLAGSLAGMANSVAGALHFR